MIIKYFVKCLKNLRTYCYNDIKIFVGFKKNKLSLFKINNYIISVIVEVDHANNMKNIFDAIINRFVKDSGSYGKISIIANWYIFCKDAGETDFHRLNVKENINYRKMFNTFCLINGTCGKIFFNPSAIENRVVSDRLEFLYGEYEKRMPLDIENERLFSVEIKHLYEVMEKILKGINKKYKYTRKVI
jgi:hypothetical protein